MSTLDRYITRIANQTILAILVSLLSILSLFALFEELDEAGVRYGFIDASWYVLQTMPRRFDELLTYCLFLGYLVALGRLAESNELTILRVSGMSPMRIMRSLTPSMLLWLTASLAVSEIIAPSSERRAEVDKLEVKYDGDALNKRGGLWFHEDQLYMQINAIDDNKIFSVTQYWVDSDKRLQATLTAEYASYDEASHAWTMHEVIRTTLDDAGTHTEHLPTWQWDNEIDPELLASQAFLEPNKMSMRDLYRQIQFTQNRNLDGTEYELALWSRAFKPLTYFGLTLFALGVVLGPLREVTMGVRFTLGIFAGLGFKYLQDLFAPAAIVFDIPAAAAILLPIAGYTCIAVYFIRRNA